MAAGTDIPQIQELARKINDLPALPALFATLTRLIQDPHTSAEQLGRALSSDPSMVSKLLKLVNSAFYGFPGRIGTVTQAIVILGFSSIRNIVLTASVMKMWDDSSRQRFDIREFWRHSLLTAALAKALALEKALPFMEELFIAGLLHDIGRMALSQSASEFGKVLDYSETQGCTWLEAERAVLGLTHADLGAFLARKWNLPEPLVEIIRGHHDAPRPAEPNSSPGGMASTLAVVRLADALSRVVADRELPEEYAAAIDASLWKDAEYEVPPGQGFRDRVREEIGRALAFMAA